MLRTLFTVSAFSLALTWTVAADAGVIINATRIIYNENSGEAITQLRNQGTSPVLIQSWIDNGDVKSKPDTVKVPFTLTPPVARIDPGKGQALRIARTGGGLPSNRESLFWLNVLEIPPKATQKIAAGDNLMQFSFRTRIKLFYRPDNLPMTPAQAYEKLDLSLRKGAAGYEIVAKNPSPYYLTFRQIEIRSAKGAPVLGDLGKTQERMVAPFGELVMKIQGMKSAPSAGLKAFYSLIDDFGGDNKNERTLAGSGKS
ncbi:MAG: fimbrial biogenesis chaperone [Pseudomonadota bacterium]|uniref:fimbrial biogenesis chaperone n=1 Tax=Serratia fonticola TaxID=47917 RepID=UPI00164599ED|nr:fimbria/pilus periplasmic chaperone [Serratia fonticola]MBC3251714.1 fimbria/pilus periplasmic chaperone [Serratia fonticola]